MELQEAAAVCARLSGDFERAVEMIKNAVETRGKVVVLGVGKSGHIGEKIAATLTSTGSPAVVLNSLNALHGDLGVVADGDVVLALSAVATGAVLGFGATATVTVPLAVPPLPSASE